MKDKIVSKLKSYGFWMSLASAVFVFLNTLGMKVDIPCLTQITTAFLGILAVAGIISRSDSSGGGDDGSDCALDGADMPNSSQYQPDSGGTDALAPAVATVAATD